MTDFSTYEMLARNYNSSWKSTFGFSGEAKQLKENEISSAPQESFFANFPIKYVRKQKTNTSPLANSSGAASIGASFRAAIVSKYGASLGETMDKQFQLSNSTQLSEKQISKIIKTISSSILPAKLNQNNWKTIEKTILSKDSGLESDYQSTMVPTAEILRSSYTADGVRGVCSRDYKNQNHSINAWSDTLKTADGHTLFSCARSGVMAVLDPQKQQKTFDARLNENILTALYARGKLPMKENDENNPIELSLVDIGLVSSYSSGINEAAIQTTQFNLLSAADQQTRTISYTPRDSQTSIKIHVRPNIRAINIGTNIGDSLSPLNAKKNDTSIRSILDETAKFLENSSKKIEPIERRAIQALYDQCREMHANKTYLTENEGDYCAFHARLALLCYKIGITPMIHCKSGTNRTSRVVEETKFLAAEINDNMIKESESLLLQKDLVPTSGKLSLSRQKSAAAFFIGVGTQEMQEVNNGYQTGSIQYYFVQKRIPNETEAIKKYQGIYASSLNTLKKIYSIFISPPK